MLSCKFYIFQQFQSSTFLNLYMLNTSIIVYPISYKFYGVKVRIFLFKSKQPWMEVQIVIDFYTSSLDAVYQRKVLIGANVAIWQSYILNQGNFYTIYRLKVVAIFFLQKNKQMSSIFIKLYILFAMTMEINQVLNFRYFIHNILYNIVNLK